MPRWTTSASVPLTTWISDSATGLPSLSSAMKFVSPKDFGVRIIRLFALRSVTSAMVGLPMISVSVPAGILTSRA